MINDLIKKFSKTSKFFKEELVYKYYEQVSKEIQSGIKEDGVWAKAFSISEGDEQKTKAKYIELMVERLILAHESEIEIKEKERREKIKTLQTKEKLQEKENFKKSLKEEWEKTAWMDDAVFKNPLYWVLGILISVIWIMNTTNSFLPSLSWELRIGIIMLISFIISGSFLALIFSNNNEKK